MLSALFTPMRCLPVRRMPTRAAASILLLVTWLAAGPLQAQSTGPLGSPKTPLTAPDPTIEVQRLAAAGQTAAALQKADETLKVKPKDPQMRFVKGVILADTGRGDDAVDVFRKLTEDYPDLPEPYNNLAALLAARGRFDDARLALEQALRANPGYAAAHENLGDIYAMLANRSYAEALRLEPANTTLPRKMTLMRQLVKAASPAGLGSAAAAPQAAAGEVASAASATPLRAP